MLSKVRRHAPGQKLEFYPILLDPLYMVGSSWDKAKDTLVIQQKKKKTENFTYNF
jgi:hypothetical protein